MSKVEIINRPIEKIGGEIKKNAWSSTIESLAIIILGVLFIAWPETMAKVVSYVVGAVLIIRGGLQVISYFMEKGQKDFFNNNLLYGVVAIILGIVALVVGQDIANVFRIVVGIWLIYESLVRVNTAMKMSSAGISTWKYVLVLALAIMVLGVFVTFNDVSTIIGWMMIAAGVISIVSDVMFIQHINTLIDKLTVKSSSKH